MEENLQLTPEGNSGTMEPELLAFITKDLKQKNDIWEERADIIEAQAVAMDELLQFTDRTDISSQNTAALQQSRMHFTSGLMHKAWNFVDGLKLFPDFFEFKPKRFSFDRSKEVVARDMTYIHGVMREKGDYKRAVRDAQKDMIRGQAIIYRDYELDENAEPIRHLYQAIPWANFRGKYDGTSEYIVDELSVWQFAEIYGKDELKNVTFGKFTESNRSIDYIDFDSLDETAKNKTIQRVIYIDAVQKRYAVILGGNGYVQKYLHDDEYPFIGQDDKGYSPFLVRNFYSPVRGYFGWGVLDILFYLARLDTTIVNATAQRAIEAASPLRIIATNNPQDMEMKWQQWEHDNAVSDANRPFFTSDTQMGTRAAVQEVTAPPANANMQQWSEFILSEAVMRTGIDFRSLIKSEPTADQQRLKKQEQDKVNIDVINRNKVDDGEFAINDLWLLKNGDSEFHSEKVEIEMDPSKLDNPEELMENGKLPTEEMTVRKFFSQVKDINLFATPRLEGALDDASFLEIETLRQDFNVVAAFPTAAAKYAFEFMSKAHPK